MKRIWMLALPLALLLCGCAPTAREPDQLALVRVLGVEGDGPVELTAVCGMDNEDQQPIRGTIVGDHFSTALEAVPWSASRELFLTSVSYFVIGEDVRLEKVLKQVLEDEELPEEGGELVTGGPGVITAAVPPLMTAPVTAMPPGARFGVR